MAKIDKDHWPLTFKTITQDHTSKLDQTISFLITYNKRVTLSMFRSA